MLFQTAAGFGVLETEEQMTGEVTWSREREKSTTLTADAFMVWYDMTW